MVDALQPAVEAMESCLWRRSGFHAGGGRNMLRRREWKNEAVSGQVWQGKILMERAVGYQDAGATSVWMILGRCGNMHKAISHVMNGKYI